MANETHDELTITIKFKGTAEAVVNALAHGLPPDALRAVHAAMTVELDARHQPELVGSVDL
jgi:hypothetical protein